MSDFLKLMAAGSKERATAIPNFQSSDFDKPVIPLTLSNFDIIAEIKHRSPSDDNHIDQECGDSHRISRAQAYAKGGAAAISVLTEPSRFAGELAHLEEVATAVPGTPVMRKDFLLEPAQVLEARKAGASGVLLIVTMLNDAVLRDMLDIAWEHGMFVLLESFDENDLQRSSGLLQRPTQSERAENGQLLIGVNTRNLRTLKVDPDRLRNLAPALPTARCVAESGLSCADDAARVAAWGYQLALVGTALMQSDDPAVLVAAMRAAGAGN